MKLDSDKIEEVINLGAYINPDLSNLDFIRLSKKFGVSRDEIQRIWISYYRTQKWYYDRKLVKSILLPPYDANREPERFEQMIPQFNPRKTP